MSSDQTTRHRVERFRQEPRRRALTVVGVTDLGPRMRRIDFTSPDLADFVSRSPDDHVKLFFPDPEEEGATVMRDYTPRRFDGAARVLTIDFALHDVGPASSWARAARVGDRLDIGGPKGSVVVPDDFDWYLLVGDESALPAIGRRLETLRPGVPVTAVMVVDGPEDVQVFETAATLDPIWVFRAGDGDDAALLRGRLETWVVPPGEGWAWIAAEAGVARALRDYLLEVRRHPRPWVKAAGYWVAGRAGMSEKMDA